MGMFDTVICDAELPIEVDHGPYHDDFQTKDFENILLRLRITKEGRLMVEAGGFGEGQEYEWHNRDGSLFSGEFNFYTNGANGRWYEFTARFEDGQLQEIVDDSERMERVMAQLRAEVDEAIEGSPTIGD